MADNKNPSDNTPHDFEEEFDFDTNEVFETDTDQLQNTSSNPAQFKSFKDKAKWPILIGIVILGFVGWKLYSVLFPSTPQSQLNKLAAEETAAINKVAHQAAPLKKGAAPAAPPPAVSPPASPPPVTTPAGSIPAELLPPPYPLAPVAAPPAQAQEETKHLENTVNQVMDSLNKMDQKLSLIGREFFALSDHVNQLSQDVAELKAKKNAPPPAIKQPIHHPRPKKHHKKHHQPPPESYPQEGDIIEEPIKQAPAKQVQRKIDLAIHAIIPGRVWLRASDGSTLTVTMGDVIPGYGKVMVIDAPSSTVVTSSGVVIR